MVTHFCRSGGMCRRWNASFRSMLANHLNPISWCRMSCSRGSGQSYSTDASFKGRASKHTRVFPFFFLTKTGCPGKPLSTGYATPASTHVRIWASSRRCCSALSCRRLCGIGSLWSVKDHRSVARAQISFLTGRCRSVVCHMTYIWAFVPSGPVGPMHRPQPLVELGSKWHLVGCGPKAIP